MNAFYRVVVTIKTVNPPGDRREDGGLRSSQLNRVIFVLSFATIYNSPMYVVEWFKIVSVCRKVLTEDYEG